MGILDGLFGGGDATTTTKTVLTDKQNEILKTAMPFFRSVGKDPPEAPSGTAIPGFNTTQLAAQSQALNTIPGIRDMATETKTGTNFLAGGDVLGSQNFTDAFGKVGSGTLANPGMSTLGGLDMTSMPPEIQSFFRSMMGTGGGMSPGATGVRDIASGATTNPMLRNLGMFTDGSLMDVNRNPALRSAIEGATRPIIDATLQKALPAIRQDFIGAGQYGGTKQGLAESQAIRDMQQGVGDTASSMMNRAYETGMSGTLQGLGLQNQAHSNQIQQRLAASGLQDTAFGRQLQARLASGQQLDSAAARDIQNMLQKAGLQDTAFGRQLQGILDSAGISTDSRGQELDAMAKGIGLAPQSASLALLPSQVRAAVGDTRYGLQSAKMQEAYQQKQLQEMWDLMLGQELAGSASLLPGGKTMTTGTPATPSPFSMLLGGASALSGMGGLGSLFSFLG